MEFLFRDRGQGKRQVKVSQDVALLEDQLGAESSSDSEFKFNEDECDADSSSSSNSSDGNSSQQSDAEGDEDLGEDEVTVLRHDKLTTQDLLTLCKRQLDTLDSNTVPDCLGILPKICGCCLGETSTDVNEIVECDGCGIAVHEGCYGIGAGAAQAETGSIASTVSSASTEPWFCEPCRAGLSRPPSCELCPVVGGVYKETDVGRWVHLVCALYVPGVAFGDPERLMNATVFEMNYAFWGRRLCSICSQEDVAPESAEPPSDEDLYQLSGGARMARTGVCIQCDAGMCKAFFHVTCAQGAGLLSEPAFVTAFTQPAQVSGGVVDSYLAHCKIHSDKTVVKDRRRTFLVQLAQTRKRRKDILDRQKALRKLNNKSSKSKAHPGESSDARIWRKLSKHRERFLADKQKNDPWLPTQKMPRLLTTSAGAIRKVQRMNALISGIDIAQQQTQEVRAISIIEAKKKLHLPPAFSVEFVAYFEDRHRRIEELKDKVENQRIEHSKLKREQADVRSHYEVVSSSHEKSEEKNKNLRAKIDVFRDILKLGGTLPETVSALKPLATDLMYSNSTPSIKARSTVYSMNQQLKFSGALSSSSKMSLNNCGICKKSHDQHLLAHCDKCKLHYHLGCLTPPLTRMPKKSKLYGWSCSECYPEVSSAEETLPMEDTSDRKRKRRMAASRARMLTLADAAGNFSGSDEHEYDWHLGFPPTKRLKDVKKFKKIEKPKTAHVEDTDSSVIPVQLQAADERAAKKAERKLLKKAEKERRKKEKKERKKNRKSNSDESVEILKTSPIRLKIKTLIPPVSGGNAEMVTYSEDLASAVKSNGHTSSNEDEVSDDQMSLSSSVSKPTRRSSLNSSSGKRLSSNRDVRTQCDKCDGPGENSNLVRCDECRRCYHFSCLFPPVKKSPKVAGYSWHCVDCDPSDRDSGWHLD